MERIRINVGDLPKSLENPELETEFRRSLDREYSLISDRYSFPTDLINRVNRAAEAAMRPADGGLVEIPPLTTTPGEREFIVDFNLDDKEKFFSIPLKELHLFPIMLMSIAMFESHFESSRGISFPLEILQDIKTLKDTNGDIDFADLQKAIDAIYSDDPRGCKTDNAETNIKFAILVCTLLQFFKTPPDNCPYLCKAAISALESPYFEASSSEPVYSNALLSFADLSPAFAEAAAKFQEDHYKGYVPIKEYDGKTVYVPGAYEEGGSLSLTNPPARTLTAIREYYPDITFHFTFTSEMSRDELNSALRELSHLEGDISLDLSGCWQITDTGLAYLEGLTTLTELNLTGCYHITDAGLAHLEGLTTLTELNLTGCYHITDAGLAHLEGLTALTELNLTGCDQITDTGLAHLMRLTALTKLSLQQCRQITDAGLRHIATLTALTSLNLALCHITNAGLRHITALDHLTSLNLELCSSITDAGLAHLEGLTTLTELNLTACSQITDTGLAYLEGLTTLTKLNLAGCHQITDVGLQHIKTLIRLTHLNLARCQKITDTGLEHIAALIALIELNLVRCWLITDAGLEHITALTHLAFLDLSLCRKITQAKVDAFRREFLDRGQHILIEQ